MPTLSRSPAGYPGTPLAKKASRVRLDITGGAVREIALPLGLIDNKVCAIADVWSGLRIVWRREVRVAKRV